MASHEQKKASSATNKAMKAIKPTSLPRSNISSATTAKAQLSTSCVSLPLHSSLSIASLSSLPAKPESKACLHLAI